MKPYIVPVLVIVSIAAVFFLDPIPQDPAYHQFADERSVFGIQNFLNVVSNITFLLVGGAGILTLRSRTNASIVDELYPVYLVFFAGVVLTAFGSGWYHLAPGNPTLVWDRLPMTVAFMSLFALLIGEQISVPAAKRLLFPLLLLGAASVLYWAATEALGRGDLRFYVLVQFLPLLLIPLILLAYQSPFDRTGFFWGMLVLYVTSKIFESLDQYVYQFGHVVSGHTLKHIVAALAPLLFLYGIRRRNRSG